MTGLDALLISIFGPATCLNAAIWQAADISGAATELEYYS